MRLTGILRRVPLFARDTGRHTGQFLDMQWARFLGEKPAYTAPATQVVTLPCHQPDPRWQLHTPRRCRWNSSKSTTPGTCLRPLIRPPRKPRPPRGSGRRHPASPSPGSVSRPRR